MWASSLVAHTLLKVKIICNYRHHIMKCHCRISGWRRGGPPPSASSPELVEGRCRRVGGAAPTGLPAEAIAKAGPVSCLVTFHDVTPIVIVIIA